MTVRIQQRPLLHYPKYISSARPKARHNIPSCICRIFMALHCLSKGTGRKVTSHYSSNIYSVSGTVLHIYKEPNSDQTVNVTQGPAITPLENLLSDGITVRWPGALWKLCPSHLPEWKNQVSDVQHLLMIWAGGRDREGAWGGSLPQPGKHTCVHLVER